MSVFQDIRSVSPNLSTPDLLRFLIEESFAGKTLVTASLKAPSVVVLKLVADVDPATPVVFCVRGFQFPESGVYRKRIVEMLGLENVSLSSGREFEECSQDVLRFQVLAGGRVSGRRVRHRVILASRIAVCHAASQHVANRNMSPDPTVPP